MTINVNCEGSENLTFRMIRRGERPDEMTTPAQFSTISFEGNDLLQLQPSVPVVPGTSTLSELQASGSRPLS